MRYPYQAIAADIARIKQRIAAIERGERGQRAGTWNSDHGGPGGATVRQLENDRLTLARLELDYVNSRIGCDWSPADIINAMEQRRHDR